LASSQFSAQRRAHQNQEVLDENAKHLVRGRSDAFDLGVERVRRERDRYADTQADVTSVADGATHRNIASHADTRSTNASSTNTDTRSTAGNHQTAGKPAPGSGHPIRHRRKNAEGYQRGDPWQE
jgi:hypothetical protein